MYSGTTFRDHSGNFIGVHQRIDSIAWVLFNTYMKQHDRDIDFPGRREILHFEGNNGPDGIKRKSPSVDEPWHFVDPSDKSDEGLYQMIDDHIYNLHQALIAGNAERASFEAAWMAHAVTDGMTPAHHYPLAKKILELWGKPKDERSSVFSKNIIKGHSRRDTLVKNWEYWGAKGIFSTHVMFELGIASAIKTQSYKNLRINKRDVDQALAHGYRAWLKEEVEQVYELDLFGEYWKRGWTPRLAKQTRSNLIPRIIKAVAIGWIIAAQDIDSNTFEKASV